MEEILHHHLRPFLWDRRNMAVRSGARFPPKPYILNPKPHCWGLGSVSVCLYSPLGCLSSALAFAMLHRPGATKAIPESQVLQERAYQHEDFHSFRIERNGSYTCGVSTDISSLQFSSPPLVALQRVCQTWRPPYYSSTYLGPKARAPPEREG